MNASSRLVGNNAAKAMPIVSLMMTRKSFLTRLRGRVSQANVMMPTIQEGSVHKVYFLASKQGAELGQQTRPDTGH